MPSPTSCTWYIWSVKSDKLELVKGYITSSVIEVSSILCPSVTKEKTLKSGKVKRKTTSIYGGYIFLKYSEECSASAIYHKLKSNPFIVSYVGSCTDTELTSVYKIQAGTNGEGN